MNCFNINVFEDLFRKVKLIGTCTILCNPDGHRMNQNSCWSSVIYSLKFYILLELENQLDKAQSRCEVLEKQLESMRKTMRGRPVSISDKLISGYPTIGPFSKELPESQSTEVDGIGKQCSSKRFTFDCEPAIPINSPAMEKIIDLEKQHLRLTASQNITEVCYAVCESQISQMIFMLVVLNNTSFPGS